jgi:hypothetical protein
VISICILNRNAVQTLKKTFEVLKSLLILSVGTHDIKQLTKAEL